jgi:hypothetical protein
MAVAPRHLAPPLALALCLLLITPAAGGAQWKTCDTGDFQVTGASLTPDIVTPGTTATFTIDVVGGAGDVAAGSVNLLVRLAGLPIYTQRFELCSKTACPVPKGTGAQLVFTQEFPKYTPRASYVVTLTGKSDSGVRLFCVDVAFKVVPASLQRHRKQIA